MGHNRNQTRRSDRKIGGEFRAMRWLARHPLFVAVPITLFVLLHYLGRVGTGAVIVGVLVGLVGWSRGHPDSFHRWVSPWLRAQWRRWTTYHGRRWAHLLHDLELVRDNPRTQETEVPRLLRVRSTSRAIDTLRVRMVRGQDVQTWTDRAEALAHALGAHRVAIAKHLPRVLTVVVEREMPFQMPLPAPAIPDDPADVDLGALDIGDLEDGSPLLVPVLRHHLLVAGATGSGKGSVLWGLLRAMGPLIRSGLVQVHVIDLKGGVETQRGKPLFASHATTMPDAVEVLENAVQRMRHRLTAMAAAGQRKCSITVETPLELVIIDELAMLTAYNGDRAATRDALNAMAEIQTQGRAPGFGVWGFVQEPAKDIVDTRDLFTLLMCLRVTSDRHPDMVLGDGARDRGALADEIEADESTAGIGYLRDQRTRIPIRFRVGHTTDDDIDDLVRRCAPRPQLTAVPNDNDTTTDDEGQADGLAS